jgi:hypothetical protein
MRTGPARGTEPPDPAVQDSGAGAEPARAPDDEVTVPAAARNAVGEPSDTDRKAEIARMVAIGVHPDVARTLRVEEPDPSKDQADSELFGLVENLGRRRRAPGGPVAVRASSDAGDYVRYSGQAVPVAAREPMSEPASVVLAPELQAASQRNATTVLIARRKGRSRTAAWLGTSAVLVALLLGARSWLTSHPTAQEGNAGREHTLTSAQPSPSMPVASVVASVNTASEPALAPSAATVALAARPSGASRRAVEPAVELQDPPKKRSPSRHPPPEPAPEPSQPRQHYLLDLP